MSRHAELGQRVLGEAVADREAERESGQRRLQELEHSLVRGREHGGERDAEEVEGGGERKDVEVGDGNDPALVRDDERVLLRGVELDRELPLGEGERVARCAVDLGQAAKRERILEVARGSVVPEVAAGEEAGQTLDRHAQPRVRPGLEDGSMQEGHVRGECLEVERPGDVHRVEQPRKIRGR